MNDKELVSRIQHGDMQAFDELYERYKDDAYRLACLITGSRTDGEDLAQYGLENPSGIITLNTADGTTTLQLGDKNAVTGQYYLKVAESDKIYLVSRDLSGTFSKTPQELLKEEETEETESVDATEGVEAAAGVDATESAVPEDSTEE